MADWVADGRGWAHRVYGPVDSQPRARATAEPPGRDPARAEDQRAVANGARLQGGHRRAARPFDVADAGYPAAHPVPRGAVAGRHRIDGWWAWLARLRRDQDKAEPEARDAVIRSYMDRRRLDHLEQLAQTIRERIR